jgi:hypothetical protein
VSLQHQRWHNPNFAELGRHHLDPSVMQKAVRRAVLSSGIITPATSHTFRHSFSPTCSDSPTCPDAAPWACAAQLALCNVVNVYSRIRLCNLEWLRLAWIASSRKRSHSFLLPAFRF